MPSSASSWVRWAGLVLIVGARCRPPVARSTRSTTSRSRCSAHRAGRACGWACSACPSLATRRKGNGAGGRPRAAGPAGRRVEGRPRRRRRAVPRCSRSCTAPILVLLDKSAKDLEGPARELTDRADDPLGVVLLILIVGVGAPIIEEIFYRGLLQRSLLKRGLPAGGGHRHHRRRVRRSATSSSSSCPALVAAGAVFGVLAHRPGGSGRPSPPTSASTWSPWWPCWSPDPMRRGSGCDDDARHGPGHHGGGRRAGRRAHRPGRAAGLGRVDPSTSRRTAATTRGRPEDPVARARRERFVRLTVDWIVVTACALFVFANLHPDQILSSAVPAGGDMGAHVWGPAYLRDHLLPERRLSGWTPDWYAGFPAYQFYMVVPSLLIVALDVGIFGGWTMVIPLAAGRRAGLRRPAAGRGMAPVGAGGPGRGGRRRRRGAALRHRLQARHGPRAAGAAALRYAFGRLADLPFPGPPLLAVASVLVPVRPELHDLRRQRRVDPGRRVRLLHQPVAVVLYLGVLLRGLRTGRHRALAAVLLALTGLCHLIPAFFALAGTVVIVRCTSARSPQADRGTLASGSPSGRSLARSARSAHHRVLGAARSGTQPPTSTTWAGRSSRTRTAGDRVPLVVGDLFQFDGETVLEVPHPAQQRRLAQRPPLGARPRRASGSCCRSPSVRVGIMLAGCALLAGRRLRRSCPRAGCGTPACCPSTTCASTCWPPSASPRWAGRSLSSPPATRTDRASIGPRGHRGRACLVALVLVGLPLRALPGGQRPRRRQLLVAGAQQRDRPAELRALLGALELHRLRAQGRLPRVPRPHADDGARSATEHGCGRSIWEYEKELNRYGTPMAPDAAAVLDRRLHRLDGGPLLRGVGHDAVPLPQPGGALRRAQRRPARPALRQASTSTWASRHLQLMGVRYYLATSAEATTAARAHPDLTELGHVRAVGDLPGGRHATSWSRSTTNRPCSTASSDAQHDWICRTARTPDDKCAGPAVAWYQDPARQDVLPRVVRPRRVAARRPRRPASRTAAARADRVEVSNIDVGHRRDRLRRRRGRRAGAREGVVLPELAGQRRRRARTGWRRTSWWSSPRPSTSSCTYGCEPDRVGRLRRSPRSGSALAVLLATRPPGRGGVRPSGRRVAGRRPARPGDGPDARRTGRPPPTSARLPRTSPREPSACGASPSWRSCPRRSTSACSSCCARALGWILVLADLAAHRGRPRSCPRGCTGP